MFDLFNIGYFVGCLCEIYLGELLMLKIDEKQLGIITLLIVYPEKLSYHYNNNHFFFGGENKHWFKEKEINSIMCIICILLNGHCMLHSALTGQPLHTIIFPTSRSRHSQGCLEKNQHHTY